MCAMYERSAHEPRVMLGSGWGAGKRPVRPGSSEHQRKAHIMQTWASNDTGKAGQTATDRPPSANKRKLVTLTGERFDQETVGRSELYAEDSLPGPPIARPLDIRLLVDRYGRPVAEYLVAGAVAGATGIAIIFGSSSMILMCFCLSLAVLLQRSEWSVLLRLLRAIWAALCSCRRTMARRVRAVWIARRSTGRHRAPRGAARFCPS
jgi:hypothetical protein